MRARAFTLIELLVVVSIIAVLIGVLLPTLGRARLAARSVVCLSNMRQLQIASLMYSEDENGRLIEPGLSEGGLSPREELSWVNTLRSYVDEGIDTISPGDMSPHWALERGGDGVPVPLPDGGGTAEGRYRASSYGVNDMVTSLFQPDLEPGASTASIAAQYSNRMQKIHAPSRTCQFLLMAEYGPFAGADHVHVQQWATQSRFVPKFLPFFAAQQASIGAYGGGAGDWSQGYSGLSGEERAAHRDNADDAGWETASNYAFLDGHAETMRFSKVYESEERNLFDPRLYR